MSRTGLIASTGTARVEEGHIRRPRQFRLRPDSELPSSILTQYPLTLRSPRVMQTTRRARGESGFLLRAPASKLTDAHRPRRSKFILISYIGSNVRVMRKAKLSVHAADVKQVVSRTTCLPSRRLANVLSHIKLRAYSIDVPANSLEDLDEVCLCGRSEIRGY